LRASRKTYLVFLRISPLPLRETVGVRGSKKVWKKYLFVVTPVKTGGQEIFKSLKILDSGVRRNDC
jgi:hypothetical protein